MSESSAPSASTPWTCNTFHAPPSADHHAAGRPTPRTPTPPRATSGSPSRPIATNPSRTAATRRTIARVDGSWMGLHAAESTDRHIAARPAASIPIATIVLACAASLPRDAPLNARFSSRCQLRPSSDTHASTACGGPGRLTRAINRVGVATMAGFAEKVEVRSHRAPSAEIKAAATCPSTPATSPTAM